MITDSGAPALLLGAFDLEHHSPWHVGRFVSHLFRGEADVREAASLLEAEGIEGLRLVDNGGLDDGRRVYHLIPDTASKAAAVEMHMRARGYAREECIAVGDSPEDLGVAAVVGRFFLVANAPERPRGGGRAA